jgi:hypothetical protein
MRRIALGLLLVSLALPVQAQTPMEWGGHAALLSLPILRHPARSKCQPCLRLWLRPWERSDQAGPSKP